MKLSNKIQLARLKLKLSLEQLSALTKISVKSLIDYEQKDLMPKTHTLRKLALALNVSEYYLLHDDESNPDANKDKELFFNEVKHKFGNKAHKEVQTVFEQTNSLFAGGNIDNDAKEVFEQALMMVYMDSKTNAKEKFTPKKFKHTIKDKK